MNPTDHVDPYDLDDIPPPPEPKSAPCAQLRTSPITVTGSDFERALLGAVLVNPEQLEHLRSVADLFAWPNLAVARAMLSLADEGVEPDPVTLKNKLNSELDHVGGPRYLGELMQGVPKSANAPHYAAQLRVLRGRQSAVAALRGAIGALEQGDSPARVAELIEAATDTLDAARPEQQALATLSIRDALATEDTSIDWLAGGIIERDGVTVLTAPPKRLKTFVALQIALDGAIGNHALDYFDVPAAFRTLWIDGEMGRGKLSRRLRRLIDGMNLPADALDTIHESFTVIPQQGIRLATDGDLDRVRRVVETCKPDLLIIDSLVAFAGGEENSASDRRRFYGDVLAPLKAEYELGVLMLAHPPLPSKDAHGDSPKRPRGSGDVVASCDRALWMYAPPGDVSEPDTSASVLDSFVSREGGDIGPTLLELIGAEGEPLTWRASPYLPDGGRERHGLVFRAEQAILKRLETEPAREMYQPNLNRELDEYGRETRKAAIKSLLVQGIVKMEPPRKGHGSGKWIVLTEAPE